MWYSKDMNDKKEKIKDFAEKNNLELIVLFGSRAKGNFREESDFDIAFLKKGKQKLFSDLSEYTDFMSEFTEHLEFSFEKMDLVDLSQANILLRKEITENGKLLYGNSIDYEDYKSFAYRDFIDARPLFDLESDLIHFKVNFLKKALA